MASQDVSMDSPPPAPPAKDGSEEPMYGGYSRFEIELEVSFLSPVYAPLCPWPSSSNGLGGDGGVCT